MAHWTEITSLEQWNAIWERSDERPVLVMKHSTRCPVSADAWQACQDFTENHPRDDVDFAWVKVVEHREVSDRIAEDLQVKHESPQALLIQNRKAIWHASHWHITPGALEKALNRQTTGR